MARALGRNHDHVEVCTRLDLTEMDVEAVGKRQRRALLDVGLDLIAVNIGVMFVRQQDHHQVGSFDGIGDFLDCDTRLFGLIPGRAVLAQTHGDLGAGVLQIVRVSVAL